VQQAPHHHVLLLTIGLLLLVSAPAPPLVASPPGGGPRPSVGEAPGGEEVLRARLLDFFAWAHPATGPGCGGPAAVEVVERWDGRVRARVRLACAEPAQLEAILTTREQDGIWQVTAGFEADPRAIDAALRDWRRRPASDSAGTLSPPPANARVRDAGDPIGLITEPGIIQESPPVFPEEAARARLIGEVKVELLVSISPEGVPTQTRILKGPEPDLGMRQAAVEAVRRYRFRPARLHGAVVRSFLPITVPFEGLPEESRSWAHRALFHVEAIVSPDEATAEAANRRLLQGEDFRSVAREFADGGGKSGDWGFVSAATLPIALRRALHDVAVGIYVGPLESDGMYYLMVKRGEIYYAIRSVEGEDVSYQVLHQHDGLQGEALRKALQSDIADFLAENRRRTFMNEAARLMGIRQRSIDLGRLVVHTDVLDEEETRLIGRVAEATIRAHEDFWGPIVLLRPFREQVQIYAFAHQADHNRLHRLWHQGPHAPEPGETDDAAGWGQAGEYIPASRILSIPCEAMDGHLPVPILIHEAIHMLDYERVYGTGVQPSKWFEEGLATYFGFSQIDSQLQIEPGAIRRSGTIVSGEVRVQFDPRARLREYLRLVRDQGPVSLRRLLTAGPQDAFWSGRESFRAYGASWTLLHFLRHGEKGRYRSALLAYAGREARGAGGWAAFTQLFGPDLTLLEADWHRYEQTL
jgi:TonB family protein